MVEDTRCRRTVTINLRDGLHLRPVAQIVETVRRFGCPVRISKGISRPTRETCST